MRVRALACALLVVVGVPDSYRGEIVKAFVVLKDDRRDQVSEADILELCRRHLSTYKLPRAVEFRTELPVSGAGKLLRRALRASEVPESRQPISS